MLFNSLEFLRFFVAVLAGFYILPVRVRPYWLLIASYWFYGSWNPRFLALLAGVTAMDYLAGLWISKCEGRTRKAILIVSLAANLSVLLFFKYFHFLTESLLQKRFAIEIVLPIGISFHIFQSISYVVDVYRRQQEPIRNPLAYALFLSFFPQLVAGPIVRAKQFFADLDPWRAPGGEDIARGAFLMTLGLTKKMAFADNFAKVSDSYFNSIGAHPGALAAWSGTLAFGLQIFFDFSGYTDMAIGMAKLLGFHFPENFRRPYLAGSITEFWRRWHISLSTWLRDYVYIPLGGNREGTFKTYRNLLITMLLGGLWHGASWNFVIWGAWHGGLLAFERSLGWNRPAWWRIPITFSLVLSGWVFFRAASFADASVIFVQLWRGPLGVCLLEGWQLALAGLAVLIALVEERFKVEDRLVSGSWPAYAVAMAMMLFVLEVFAVVDVEIPFVYFQF